jgi:tetratricopeptide (TPR) repeat protein
MTPPWSSRSASPLSGQLILSAVLGSATSIRPLQEALGRSEDGRISVEDTELSEEEYARYQADVAEESRSPFQALDGLAAAVAAARAAGLLAPVTRGDEPVLHFVRRWTARAIAALRPGATRQAHQRAAAFWRWRVATLPQSREDAIDQLLEARYHYHAAGQDDQAMTAQRGDYATAEPLYRRALDISERIGDQGGTAASYHQLGTLAQDRGDYDTAEPLYRHALDILERISDQAGMATSYAVLGGLSEARGNLDQAVTYP